MSLGRREVLPVAANAVLKVTSMAAEPAILKKPDIICGNCFAAVSVRIAGGFFSAFSLMDAAALKKLQVARLDISTALKDMGFLLF